MILPSWLTIHVLGYGLASGIIVGAGAYALHEHDAKIRAEDKAIAARDADTLRTRLMQDAIDRASARVETVTVALKPIIQNTKTIVDSARRHVTDTLLVKQALNSSDESTAKCSELIVTCGQFRTMATDSMRVLRRLLAQRDDEAVRAHAPLPAPRFSRGLELGVGECVTARPIDGRTSVFGAPCLSITYGFHLRLF